MDEQEAVNSAETQVATDANVSHDTVEQSQEAHVEAEAKTDQGGHFKRLRQQKVELERKLKMQEEMMERLMKVQQQPQPPPEVDELDQIADDEFISKGKVKQLVAKQAQKIAKEIAQQEMQQLLQQQQQSQFLTRLKGQFSDFDQIVNQETLAILEETEPELAATIAESKDPYKMMYQSYKFIKKLGIGEETPKARHSKEVEKKIEKNSKTVQSPQAYDKRPMAQAFKMTETMREDLAKEMRYYANQASSVPQL